MYMRATWGRVKPGQWEDYEAAYRRGAADAGQAVGMKSHRLLRDIDDPDTGVTLLTLDTRDAMQAYTESANRATRLAAVQAYFPAAFVINHLEVILDEDFR
jgi:heme-degrading monooxygenase HmoA